MKKRLPKPKSSETPAFPSRSSSRRGSTDILLGPQNDEGILSLAAIRDITPRKRAEKQLRLLAEVTGIASEAEDIVTMTRQCLSAISRYGRWQMAQAWWLEESPELLRCDPETLYPAKGKGEPIEIVDFRNSSLS